MGPALGCALCGAACAACSSSSPPRRALVTTILSARSDSPAPRNLDANQLHNSHFGGERFPRQPSAAHSYVSRRLQSRCRRWCAPAERAQPCTAQTSAPELTPCPRATSATGSSSSAPSPLLVTRGQDRLCGPTRGPACCVPIQPGHRVKPSLN